ncbi:HD-GYP domain-containing protein (c-di-GMP phosphodiesterase class II) [Paenibacillus phyllosphaerae]|uniref:HD-GYP domain-containing protein (C-di-GMP phosphodiesterase class II) n=1 Tax=Paenibacillus phyllosphaerae TaxID=274593 RepID=A0A7W5B2J3_9BACL|nr:HD-GYP domain-containing protein [Paenibacillus phyllosphaerae]MBB3113272.1 HD-GYP domain-containing protein (c-di-GMP phosphodiesterase class II) [Paenibacillus phyllosphaerae]
MAHSDQHAFIGYRVRRDIFTSKGTLLLPSGTVLKAKHADLLRANGITLGTDDVTDLKLADETQILEAVMEIKEIFGKVQAEGSLPIDWVKDRVLPKVMDLTSRHANLLDMLRFLHDKDEYTYRHTFAVGVIASMIGRWLGIRGQELIRLSMSASVHDIGKSLVASEILLKPGRLTAEEFDAMKEHAKIGYRLLKDEAVDEVIALVALQHHEREDGTGYPDGVRAEQIHLFSKIVAVADVFHAMTSNRVYKAALPYYEVMTLMWEGKLGSFQRNILNLFIKHIMELHIGKSVVLNDGSPGKIVYVSSSAPLQPLVSRYGVLIDLRLEQELNIREMV